MSKESITKEKILLEVKAILREDRDALLEYETTNPKSFRLALNTAFRNAGISHKITTRLVGGKIFIIIRESTYTEKLERMVRKLAMHTDDEKLFEEAASLVTI